MLTLFWEHLGSRILGGEPQSVYTGRGERRSVVYQELFGRPAPPPCCNAVFIRGTCSPFEEWRVLGQVMCVCCKFLAMHTILTLNPCKQRSGGSSRIRQLFGQSAHQVCIHRCRGLGLLFIEMP